MNSRPDFHLRPLSELESSEDAGGKAWSLARMGEQGVSVPPGVVLSCAAFDRFIIEHDLQSLESDPRLDLADLPRFTEAAAQLQERVLACSLPTEVDTALTEWWTESDQLWIVRSSAVGEDSQIASFAGQLDSVLHVQTLDQLRTAILRCWASYWSERALFYRVAKGVPLRSMGVVIQEMIQPKRGGVLFTRAPDDPEALRIEYVDGHPEGLVNGSLTPQSLVLPRAQPQHPELGELVAQALALEATYGAPQDIEWVIDQADRLWLVQSRPITVPVAPGRSVVWSNVNVNENYPEPISPLLFSIAREAYENYFGNIGRAFGFSDALLDEVQPNLRYTVGTHGARLYYNLSNIHHCIRAAPFGAHLASAFDGFVGVDDEGKTGGRTQTQTADRVSSQFELIRAGISAARSLSTLSRRVVRFEQRIDAYAHDSRSDQLSTAGIPELFGLTRRFLDIRFRRWTDASLADVAATLSYAALKALLRARLDDDAAERLPSTLLLAIPDVVSAGAVESLWDLSRTAQADAALCEALREGDWDALYQRLCDGAHPPFHAAMQAHLAQWGFRVSGELMLTVPCFQEEPATLLPLIAGYIDLEGPSPHEATAAQARRRDDALTETCDRLGWRWALALRLALRTTQRSIGYRERVRLKQALLYRRFRRVLLALGERLVAKDRLTQADDLFYLEWPEIDAWLSGNHMLPQTIPQLVALRREAHAAQSQRAVPDTIRLPEGDYLSAESNLPTEHHTGHQLEGVGVSGGRVRASARVMASLQERAQFQRGEILVARQTDPGWAPLFFLASGLVMERGGMLSHGAIVAREFGIPAVIAVPKATERLTTGEWLTVDGDHGVVLREEEER